jgi:hypothetical protein
MATTEVFALPDKNIIPDDNLIFSIIGDKKPVWQAIMTHVHENYKETNGEWRFYNDGKQWLFKMQQKKKTIFWIAILQGTFRITFYFGRKAEPVIEASDLPKQIRDDFKTSKLYGTIKAISLKIAGMEDVDTVKKLIAIKSKLK